MSTQTGPTNGRKNHGMASTKFFKKRPSEWTRKEVIQFAAPLIVAIAAIVIPLIVTHGSGGASGSGGGSGSSTSTGSPHTSPIATRSTSAPTPSPSQPVPAGVFYQGSAGIPSTGMDFDHNPPMPGSGNVSATSLGLESFSSNVLLSQYLGSSSKPNAQECRAWVKSHGSYSVGPVPGQGDEFCFLTEQGRTVLFVVTSVNPEPNGNLINGQATVWNAP